MTAQASAHEIEGHVGCDKVFYTERTDDGGFRPTGRTAVYGPDSPEYYTCSCGLEFDTVKQVEAHLRSVDGGDDA